MKIGLFIGSFNPVHNDHHKIVEIAKSYVDKIIVIPTNEKYHLKSNLISFKHRYEMLKLVFKEEDIIVSDLEKEKYHYTYQNIKKIRKEYKNDDLFLIMGADNLLELKTWKNYRYLLNNCFFIIFKRNNIDIETLINNCFTKHLNKFIIVSSKLNDISSTLIRNKLENNEDVKVYLNESILNYIKKNNLYKGE